MQQLRLSNDRGSVNLGWLTSRHSFSFGQYYDPGHLGHGPLRVINEDIVQPGKGFDTHSHRDMEILTVVLRGALEHRDSLGTGSIIRPGDVQRMSAGTGVQHSEFNASNSEPVHFLQIWVEPDTLGLPPSYEQQHFAPADCAGVLKLVASKAGQKGALRVSQDLSLYRSLLLEGEQVTHALATDRLGWVQVARGSITLNGQTLAAGDGAALQGEQMLTIIGGSSGLAAKADQEHSELLLFDMAQR